VNEFTAHNIVFPDGSRTMPEQEGLLRDLPWFHCVHRILKLIFSGDLAGHSIADLGCLEGGYTAEFARLGLDATGIEVRESNFENCLHVAEKLNLPNLKFVRDDVWELERYGRFDVIFCNGLLYHLDSPRAFVSLMGRCARDAVIINTHFAPKEESEAFTLSPLVQHEGLPGRWYEEHELDTAGDHEELEALKWASWANRTSFWPTREGLAQCLQDAGFDMILEPLDWTGFDMLGGIPTQEENNRVMLVGIRSGVA
jgi:SAM-dependent methyltransferase